MNSNLQGSPSPADSISPPYNMPDVTGWLSTEAQDALEPTGYAVHLIQTYPPQRNVSPKRAPEYSGARKPQRVPVFGEWRVLRWRMIGTATEPAVELLVARELLGETHIDNPTQ